MDVQRRGKGFRTIPSAEGRARTSRRSRMRIPGLLMVGSTLIAASSATPSAATRSSFLLPDAERQNEVMADRLVGILRNGAATPSLSRAPNAAQAPLRLAPQLVGIEPVGALPDSQITALLAQKQINLGTARTLLGVLERNHPDALAQAVTLAKAGTMAQARTLDPSVDTSSPSPATLMHASPNVAALALITRYDVVPTSEQRQLLLALDVIGEPLRSALTRFLDAFIVFADASRASYERADLRRLLALVMEARRLVEVGGQGQEKLASSSPTRALVDSGVNLAPILAARAALLDATVALRNTLALTPPWQMNAATMTPIQVPPVLSIDLAGDANTYTTDFVLLLDAAGDDTYLNNAGGSNLSGGSCDLVGVRVAAALVDFDGADRYTNGRSCGANGGGHFGSGFLVDAGGNDAYTGGSFGANGGSSIGTGFLLDAEGNDTYAVQGNGANGGGEGGAGFLVDAGGNDTYSAGNLGVNGGGDFGSGFLIDASGNDAYTAGDFGANGGSRFGTGFLLDVSGHDVYTAGNFGANGGGILFGSGFLVDASGNDVYTAAGNFGANGGAAVGVGLLFDGEGRDQYQDASSSGTDQTVIPKGLVGAQVDAPF